MDVGCGDWIVIGNKGGDVIKQYMPLPVSDYAEMIECPDGEWVSYEDYVRMVELLKAIHATELKEAYSRAYDDGKSSNYSWRL